MSYLNLQTQFIIYSDPNVENPKVRLADISDSFTGITLADVKSQEVVIDANSTYSIVNNQRSLGVGIDTAEFQILRPIASEDIIRLEWTGNGGNPAFKTARVLGVAADTVVSMTRVGPRTMRLQHVSGTALNTTQVLAGDKIFFESSNDSVTSPFSLANQNKYYTVQAKSSTYIDFADEGVSVDETAVTLGASFAVILKVFAADTPSTPRINDTIKIVSPAFSSDNKGSFQITKLTDSYVEFVNPYGVLETVTNTASGIYIFDKLIGFVYIVSTGDVEIIPDGQSVGMKLQKLDANISLFFGSISASRIDIKNLNDVPVAVRSQYAAVTGC